MDLPEDYDLGKLNDPFVKSIRAMKKARGTRMNNDYHCKMCNRKFKKYELWAGYCDKCWEAKEAISEYHKLRNIRTK
jgi:hypothetical protein